MQDSHNDGSFQETDSSAYSGYRAMNDDTLVQPQNNVTEDVLVGNVSSNDDSSLSQHHKTTAWQTFVHILKGNIGPGMLSLPWAFSVIQSIPLAFGAVMVMALWSSYNCWTLVRIKRYMESQQGPADSEHGETENDNRSPENASEVPSGISNITYPDVGAWAYGPTFQSYVRIAVCVQQLAVCTVFISFVGENLLAVLESIAGGESAAWWATHSGVMTLSIPCYLAISYTPTLKGLSSVVALATLLLFVTLALIFVIGWQTGPYRPRNRQEAEEEATSPLLALCAILFSFEGICLVLPTESAMQNPQRDFGKTYVAAMVVVTMILCSFSAATISAFGNVTNGSVTAFLMREYGTKYEDEQGVQLLVLFANASISFSVLLTYPLQLYPAVELIAPHWSRLWEGSEQQSEIPENIHEEIPQSRDGYDDQDGFRNSRDDGVIALVIDDPAGSTSQKKAPSRNLREQQSSLGAQSDDGLSAAIAVTNWLAPKMVIPGDSIQLRTVLVMLTYLIAVIVPNVQNLISLAGALAGSSTALLIPPLLELAWVRRLERERQSLMSNVELEDMFPEVSHGHVVAEMKCFVLFGLGLAFLCVGTYSSLADIL